MRGVHAILKNNNKKTANQAQVNYVNSQAIVTVNNGSRWLWRSSEPDPMHAPLGIKSHCDIPLSTSSHCRVISILITIVMDYICIELYCTNLLICGNYAELCNTSVNLLDVSLICG